MLANIGLQLGISAGLNMINDIANHGKEDDSASYYSPPPPPPPPTTNTTVNIPAVPPPPPPPAKFVAQKNVNNPASWMSWHG